MSLMAKNSPKATSFLVDTPKGGGLDNIVCMIGRSMVSWSMSLKRAVATRRTVSLCLCAWGMMVGFVSSPPRTMSCCCCIISLLTESRRLLRDDDDDHAAVPEPNEDGFPL